MSQENLEIMRSRGQLPISDRQLRRLLRYPGALALIFRLVVRVPRRMWPRRNVAISEVGDRLLAGQEVTPPERRQVVGQRLQKPLKFGPH